jgi:hypothetical protein
MSQQAWWHDQCSWWMLIHRLFSMIITHSYSFNSMFHMRYSIHQQFMNPKAGFRPSNKLICSMICTIMNAWRTLHKDRCIENTGGVWKGTNPPKNVGFLAFALVEVKLRIICETQNTWKYDGHQNGLCKSWKFMGALGLFRPIPTQGNWIKIRNSLSSALCLQLYLWHEEMA